MTKEPSAKELSATAETQDLLLEQGLALPVLAETPTDASLRIDDRYEILNLLGVGGMGSVYKVRDHELDEIVALKVLSAERVGTEKARQRFRREAKLARRVTHTNVVRTFDLGSHRGNLYIAMEFVPGESLASRLQKKKRLSLRALVYIATQVCEGLQAAHEAHVIHRDLKPDNVMIAADGRVVLTDFGIARFSYQDVGITGGGVVGTPAYMAPEQVLGDQEIDARADIYALGTMLFEMATGVRAWPGEDFFAVVNARLFQDPPDLRSLQPALPEALSALVQRCMARAPDDRYGSVVEVKEALARLGALPLQESPAPSLPAHSSFSPKPAHGAEKSLAVCLFRYAGPPEKAYLAEGFCEELTDVLSVVAQLKVRPWSQVLRMQHHEQLEPLARALDVQILVQGTLQCLDDALQLRVRLYSATEGFQVWAQRFGADARGFLPLCDEVAQAIAEVLTVVHRQEIRQVSFEPQALEAYLHARKAMRRGWFGDLSEAIALFQRALQLAPENGLALSGLAMTYARMSWKYMPEKTQLDPARGRQFAQRAVAASPQRGEAHCAMGYVHFSEGDIGRCVHSLNAAIGYAPTLNDAHSLLGRVYAEVGPLRLAKLHSRTACTLDPTDYIAWISLSKIHAMEGDWQATKAAVDEAYNAAQDEISQAIIGLSTARYAFWTQERDWLPSSDLNLAPFHLIFPIFEHVFTERDVPPKLQAIHQRVLDGSTSRIKALGYQLTCELYAYCQSTEPLLQTLEEAIEKSDFWDLMWMRHSPKLTFIHQDPRFHEVVEHTQAKIKAWFPSREEL